MKTINVLSRSTVLKYLNNNLTFDLPSTIISIYGEEKSRIFPVENMHSSNLMNHLNVMVSDITEKYFNTIPEGVAEKNGIILFNEDHARSIIHFIDRVATNYDGLIIHCAQGISRSGAVGLWATRYLGLDEEEFRYKHPSIAPNETILEVLMKTSGLTDYYKKFWDEEWGEGEKPFPMPIT